MNNHLQWVIYIETRVQPELIIRRKVCKSCGRGTYEFAPDTTAKKYVCSGCSI